MSVEVHPGRVSLGVGRWLDGAARMGEALVLAAVAADIAITFASTVLRYATGRDLAWAADVSSLLIPLIAFLGGACFFRRGSGMAYRALVERVGGLAGAVLEAIGLWTVVGVCGLALLRFPDFLAGQSRQILPVLDVPASLGALWLGVGLALLVVFTLEALLRLARPAVVLGVVIVALCGGALVLLRLGYASGLLELDPFWLIVPLVVAVFLVGTPIPLILALAGEVYYVVTGDAPLVAIPTGLQYGVSSFILLAIPFFMIAGSLMEVTGMAARLVRMVLTWCGWLPGGLLIAEVVATYIFSGISGSKAADMATIGAVMKQPMRERGYPSSEFAAVLCASAAMSETVPPSLAMLILGSVTSLSIGALFVAGIVPAIVLAIALIVAVVLRARRYRWDNGMRFSLRAAVGSVPAAIPALGVPVIVIGGIVGGFASPTESGSLAAIYGLAAAVLAGRRIGLRQFWLDMRDAALTAGMVLLLVACANVLGQAIVVDGLGTAIGGALAGLHHPILFLALSMVALIVIGFILEGFPAILIAAPIFVPAAQLAGIDPLQFGILLIMATGIGVMLPPAGIGFYIACTVTGAPLTATMRASLVYNLFLVAGLAVVVLAPQVTLWLPHLLGLH